MFIYKMVCKQQGRQHTSNHHPIPSLNNHSTLIKVSFIYQNQHKYERGHTCLSLTHKIQLISTFFYVKIRSHLQHLLLLFEPTRVGTYLIIIQYFISLYYSPWYLSLPTSPNLFNVLRMQPGKETSFKHAPLFFSQTIS